MILSCGEALIDMLPRTTQSGEDAFAPHAGGAVFNTAIALGRLGAPSSFFAGLSDDLFGTLLKEQLAASHVASDLCPVSDLPTTLAFVKLTDGQAKYAFYDENTALRALSPDDLPDLPDDTSALFFGGISLVYGPCAEAYEALMHRESETRVTMIDPNIRPSFIRNEGKYRARLERMIASADIVKLSDEDLHWLEGDGDIKTLAQGICARGPYLVLITEGAKGAAAYGATREFFVPANKVDVIDTVGAGDTFNAGFLASLHKSGALTKEGISNASEATITDALTLGIKSAAITVSRAGANPPWENEV
jgi:fructokinase